MAIFGLFKKDKSKTSSSQASTSSVVIENESAEDYVLSPPSLVLPTVANGDDGYASSTTSFVSNASSKKMRLPFSKKSSQSPSSPLTRPIDTSRNVPNYSNDKLSLSLDNTPSILPHSPVFPSFHQSNSSPTLVRPEPAVSRSRPQPTALQKSEASAPNKTNGGLFGWRERKKSKPSKPEIETLVLPPLSDDSFNLKSFRHVLPEQSRSTSPPSRSPAKSPSPTSLLPPARPRGASVASADSSQRISVAAFREAQARRSSTNLVSGSPSPTIRPISLANSVTSDLIPPRPPRSVHPSISDSPSPVNGRKPQTFRNSSAISSSETTSSDESDSECSSRSRPRSRLSRQHTITKRSQGAKSDAGHDSSRVSIHSQQQQRQTPWARSEHGHSSPRIAQPSPSRGPPPSSFQNTTENLTGTRSLSIYRRQRASYSTSELNPNAAAQRASTLAQANERERQASQSQIGGDSDTSETSSESDSSDEDAPLASLKQPRRPSSNISHSSFASSRKPLIDLNLRSNPITGKPLDSPTEAPPSRSNMLSPTNINGRLANLTVQAGLNDHRTINNAKSEANLAKMAIPKPSFMDSSKSISPASTETVIPPVLTKSPEPMSPRQSRALSSPTDMIKARSGDFRPIPVKDRTEKNSGFTVVSRPQKSATVPPSGAPTSNEQQRSTAISHHRHSSSFTITSRPLSGLESKPLVASSQSGTSISGSASNYSASVSGSGSGSGSGSLSSPPSRSNAQGSPQRPFVLANKRQESPASSTGGSSNGKGPLTPMDGSDYFVPAIRGNGDSPSGSSINATPPSALKGGRGGGHTKRASVTFQDQISDKDETIRGRSTSMGSSKVDDQGLLEERESRLKERRRSEAKAAIELGKVINGNGPIQDDDDDDPILRNGMLPQLPHMGLGGGLGLNFNNMQMSWQQQGMSSPMMGPMNGMKGPQGMNMNMQQFMVPPAVPGADPNFLVAHQQAMAIAKQAYQYAVAQQAMAAAADEWERGSSVSAFAPNGGGMGMGMTMGNMGNMGMGGYGMGGMNPMAAMSGMGGMWGGGGQMFPAAPRSMYAGSMGGAMSEAGWGASSVYGESFGPSMSANARRSQILSGNVRDSVVFPGGSPSSQQVSSPNRVTKNNARPRTRTAPSNAPLPSQHRQNQLSGPPSSWKAVS